MSYKVTYYTLAIMENGRAGNIKQSFGHVFTDKQIPEIPEALNAFLKASDRVGVIEKIEDVKGNCI